MASSKQRKQALDAFIKEFEFEGKEIAENMRNNSLSVDALLRLSEQRVIKYSQILTTNIIQQDQFVDAVRIVCNRTLNSQHFQSYFNSYYTIHTNDDQNTSMIPGSFSDLALPPPFPTKQEPDPNHNHHCYTSTHDTQYHSTDIRFDPLLPVTDPHCKSPKSKYLESKFHGIATNEAEEEDAQEDEVEEEQQMDAPMSDETTAKQSDMILDDDVKECPSQSTLNDDDSSSDTADAWNVEKIIFGIKFTGNGPTTFYKWMCTADVGHLKYHIDEKMSKWSTRLRQLYNGQCIMYMVKSNGEIVCLIIFDESKYSNCMDLCIVATWESYDVIQCALEEVMPKVWLERTDINAINCYFMEKDENTKKVIQHLGFESKRKETRMYRNRDIGPQGVRENDELMKQINPKGERRFGVVYEGWVLWKPKHV
eukprot:276635_1